MATTGTKLTIPFTVGTGQIVGQGPAQELWCLYSTDDASVSTPNWNDATPQVRSFSTSRGRDSELGEVSPGTATLALDNRTRTFDPLNNVLIRPFNRWWIREQFTGETQDIFKGYAESYDLKYPSTGRDAVAVVQCADEWKDLALSFSPVTDPPRDTYQALVQFDAPDIHYDFSDDAPTFVQEESPESVMSMEWDVEWPPPQKVNDPSSPSGKKNWAPHKGH